MQTSSMEVSDTVLAVTSNALNDSATIESHQLWRVELLCSEEPDVSDLASSIRELGDAGITIKPRIQRVPDRDWVVSSQQASQPVRAGRYFVHASHYKGPKPPGAVTLVVNAGPAFGTGTHESTYGCLIALDDLAKRVRIKRPLDLGAGSGILSMAVCRTWNCRVLGVDIDPRAVAFAHTTSLFNHLHRQIDFLVSNGCRHRRVSERKPYDLIIANILAAPLMWMAGDIGQHLAPGGRVILSGLLRQQERRVLAPLSAEPDGSGETDPHTRMVDSRVARPQQRYAQDNSQPGLAHFAAGLVRSQFLLRGLWSGAVPNVRRRSSTDLASVQPLICGGPERRPETTAQERR